MIGLPQRSTAAGWTASAQPFPAARGLGASDIQQRFLGVAQTAADNWAPEAATPAPQVSLPPSFDWRANASLSGCIGPVVEQSPVINGTVHKCGSCWAVSAVETLSDRLCLAERTRAAPPEPAAPRLELSALDLIACDKECKYPFHRDCNMGCLGGFPSLAWDFFHKEGVVSASCMPYNLSKQLLCPLTPCEPKALRSRHKVKRSYQVFGGDSFDGIRHELVANGPVQATFAVFEDFMHYTGGVYRHVAGRKLGLHAVKVIGFGSATANGTNAPYWLAINSWGPTFGVNGTFMIGAGDSGTGFEQQVLAGEPCLSSDRIMPCGPVAAAGGGFPSRGA